MNNLSADINLEPYLDAVHRARTMVMEGRVVKVVGLVIEGDGPSCSVGDMCRIYPSRDNDPILAEVVGFQNGTIQLMPLGPVRGLTPGSRILPLGEPASINLGPGILGRVVNGMGETIDGLEPFETDALYPIHGLPGNPLARARITEPIDVGIRSINALLSIGKGQRVGIFSGSGVGKSTLLGMIAKNTKAEVNVIALIGERGREVKEFIENDLGPEGMKHSVVVAATSDQPPLVRIRGAYVATAIAEYFRDQGADVLLMMDSATRFAHASREVGLSIGEPPTTRGYTPSVFTQLPLLLERAGVWETGGSITGLYTVLVEGDDLNEPISDALRSILDGHINLDRELASHNQYPSVAPLTSISRLMTEVTDDEHVQLARKFNDVMATYERSKDMINIGAYVRGSNEDIDYSIKMKPLFDAFMRQGRTEKIDFEQTQKELKALFG